MGKLMNTIKDHYIICGYGKMGKQMCDNLYEAKKPFVVIENDHKKIEELIEKDIPYVEGDATMDSVIIEAGIKKAKGFAAVIKTDAENVFATLSAKGLNPSIYVVSRAIEEGTEQKLYKAGADRVVKPYELSGTKLVQLLLRPGVSDFIDVVSKKSNKEIHIEELTILSESSLIGQKLSDTTFKKELNIMVIAVTRENGTLIYNPQASFEFNANDKVIVIGEEKNLSKFIEICSTK
jgi:voltage-gated potassium channel